MLTKKKNLSQAQALPQQLSIPNGMSRFLGEANIPFKYKSNKQLSRMHENLYVFPQKLPDD